MYLSLQIPETPTPTSACIVITHEPNPTYPPTIPPPTPHHYYAAAGSSSFLPMNIKLGLNEICASNQNNDATVFSCINQGGDALFHGGQAPQSSPGIPHCWLNQQDSITLKQQPLWELVAAKVSHENRNTIDRQEDIDMDFKEALKYRLESKNGAIYGELEAVYKNFTISGSDQTGPREITPPEASIREAATKNGTRKRRKKKNRTAQFFEQLVSKMMHHQENLQRRFSEVIERLDEERREREEAWRNRKLASFEVEAEARAREKALAAGREAAIFSYLEIITGENFRPPTFNSSESSSRFD